MPQCSETSIDEMLEDPLVRALMVADRVDSEELRALLRSVADDRPARPSEPSGCDVRLHRTKSLVGDHSPPLPSKERQWAKIRQFIQALLNAGYRTLDDQAAVLGLHRSTVWSILRGKHKNSGLSTTIIFRMLEQQALPPAVRARLIEYIEEKRAGLYGDKPVRIQQFMGRLFICTDGRTGHPVNTDTRLVPRSLSGSKDHARTEM